ncbi:conserved hypothetical protein [Staphylococcus aureus]|nr:conserved hypothetical protein [Staphylococcus aureus]CRI15308.1 conserved hypothetical protein [Staphylococcus aureus]CRI16653.1 conserved hypothetical protein [Staphylococcus aureus]CRI16811.1 conserved hypothetical protein [Staphylococcus aureus]CRI20902.1 conserved hypothetical protein [Staphylococcus aureus]
MKGKDAEIDINHKLYLLGQFSNRNCTVTECDVLPYIDNCQSGCIS